jgi:thiol-disulfide isomerase/thioredoxin
MSTIQNPPTEDGNGKPSGASKRSLMSLAIGTLMLIGVAYILYVILSASIKPKAALDLNEFKVGALTKLQIVAEPRPVPTASFKDADGKPVTLADFKGQVVVLNLWATWCGPCKEEMPTLAKLQAAYAASPFKVVAVSVDSIDYDDLARSDIAKTPPLALYRDAKYALAFGLTPRPAGLPTTLIIDRKGMERARLEGGADWSSPQARGLVEALLAEK